MGRTAGSLSGDAAGIRWSYYTAADVSRYTVTRSAEGRWSVVATVPLHDPFKMSMRPLTFVARLPSRRTKAIVEWRWPMRAHTLVDGCLRADLDPPEGS